MIALIATVAEATGTITGLSLLIAAPAALVIAAVTITVWTHTKNQETHTQ